MADIIAEAGLSAGSIYSHFSSKSELLRFVVSDVLESRFTTLIDDVRANRGEIAPPDLLAHLLGKSSPDSSRPT